MSQAVTFAWQKKLAWSSSLAWLMLGAPVAFAAKTPQPLVEVKPEGVHVVINLPQTRLFLYRDGKLENDFPVAVGKAGTRTPAGEYTVTAIAHNPTWHVPASIQREMQRAGKPVLKVVPPGPSNPLGKVFVRFGPPSLSLGIHGTNAPGSIPGFRSHGCVRMKNPDALFFAKQVKNGVPVSVVYQPLLLNTDAAGELWMTVLPDAYRRGRAVEKARDSAETWARHSGKTLHVQRWEAALKRGAQTTVCLSCLNEKNPAPKDLIALNTQLVPAEVLPKVTLDNADELSVEVLENIEHPEMNDAPSPLLEPLPSELEASLLPPVSTPVDLKPELPPIKLAPLESQTKPEIEPALPVESGTAPAPKLPPIKLAPLEPKPDTPPALEQTPETLPEEQASQVTQPAFQKMPAAPTLPPIPPLPPPTAKPSAQIDSIRIEEVPLAQALPVLRQQLGLPPAREVPPLLEERLM